MVVEVGEHRLLVDPMLGPRKSVPPFTLFRHPPRWNPLQDLPENSSQWLSGLSACVIANHLEALNHCPTTRVELRNWLESEGLSGKVPIPRDGETIEV